MVYPIGLACETISPILFNNFKIKIKLYRRICCLKYVYYIYSPIWLTRYPPKCRTWQVNVASLPTATEILTIGSANSGWKDKLPENKIKLLTERIIFYHIF